MADAKPLGWGLHRVSTVVATAAAGRSVLRTSAPVGPHGLPAGPLQYSSYAPRSGAAPVNSGGGVTSISRPPHATRATPASMAGLRSCRL